MKACQNYSHEVILAVGIIQNERTFAPLKIHSYFEGATDKNKSSRGFYAEFAAICVSRLRRVKDLKIHTYLTEIIRQTSGDNTIFSKLEN